MSAYLLMYAAAFVLLFLVMYVIISYAYFLGMRDGRSEAVRNIRHIQRYQ